MFTNLFYEDEGEKNDFTNIMIVIFKMKYIKKILDDYFLPVLL